MVAAVKEGPGRPQEMTLTGPGYRLAEFLNQNWDRVGETNQELAIEWNYRSPGIVSMWRTGKSRVPIERLSSLAHKLRVDMAILLPLWIDQFAPNRDGAIQIGKDIENVFKRLSTHAEFAILKALRNGSKTRGVSNPDFSESQVRAFEQIAADDSFAQLVLDEARKQGMIKEIETADQDEE